MTTVFFPLVDGGLLEAAVVQTLQDWFPVYTKEFELQRGIEPGSLPQPRSWVVTDDVEREASDMLPSIVVVSPGLNGDRPMADGDGSFRAAWMVGVGCFVSGNTRDATAKLVRMYAAIIRAIMLQKRGLDGTVSVTNVSWLDESYDDNFQFTDTQTISAGQVIFNIELDSVAHRYQGPIGSPDPNTQPGSGWPGVQSTTIDVGATGQED